MIPTMLVYTKLTYSGKGKDVATADKERDVAFSSLKAFLNGYRKLPSAANQQDAEALYTVFKTFGLNLDGLSYSAQTAQLKITDRSFRNTRKPTTHYPFGTEHSSY